MLFIFIFSCGFEQTEEKRQLLQVRLHSNNIKVKQESIPVINVCLLSQLEMVAALMGRPPQGLLDDSNSLDEYPYEIFTNVDIISLLPPGVTVETYQPTPQQVYNFSSSLAFISIGVPFEKVFLKKALDSISSKEKKPIIISQSSKVDKISLFSSQENISNIKSVDNHHDVEEDFHIWLSLYQMPQQLSNVKEGFIELFPNHQSIIEKNASLYLEQIQLLQKKALNHLSNYLEKNKSLPKILTYHQSWNYILNTSVNLLASDESIFVLQKSIEVHGKEPGPKHIQRVKKWVDKQENHHHKKMIIQPGLSLKNINQMASFLQVETEMWNALAVNNLSNIYHIYQRYLHH